MAGRQTAHLSQARHPPSACQHWELLEEAGKPLIGRLGDTETERRQKKERCIKDVFKEPVLKFKCNFFPSAMKGQNSVTFNLGRIGLTELFKFKWWAKYGIKNRSATQTQHCLES